MFVTLPVCPSAVWLRGYLSCQVLGFPSWSGQVVQGWPGPGGENRVGGHGLGRAKCV